MWCGNNNYGLGRYLYGKAVHGHMNVTFIYHLHGGEEAFHEHMQVFNLW